MHVFLQHLQDGQLVLVPSNNVCIISGCDLMERAEAEARLLTTTKRASLLNKSLAFGSFVSLSSAFLSRPQRSGVPRQSERILQE